MNVKYLLHKGRQHGLTPSIMKQIKDDLPDLLLIPDASTNDIKQHKELKDLGVDIIVKDHHVAEVISQDAIIVSNDPLISPDYPNRELTGAGITLKFVEALSEKYGIDIEDKYLSLASVGIVADMVTVLHPETRYYVYRGLKDAKNPVIQHFIYKNAYHVLREAHPKVVSFNISNYMNAIIRAGTQEDKETMLRGLLGEEEEELRTYTYRGKKMEKLETLKEKVYRLSSNARSRQNNLKKKIVKQVMDIAQEDYDKNDLFTIVALDELEEGYSGLIGGDIAQYYKRPCLIMNWNENRQLYTGSMRGYEPVMDDAQSFLLSLGLFEFVSGHPNASGVAITKENLELLPQAIKDNLPKDLKQSKLEVDFEIKQYQLNGALAYELDKLEKFFVKGFEEPLFAIKDVQINTSEIKYGVPLRIPINDVEAVIFKGDKDLEEYELENKTLVCDIVGKLGVNRFLGKETPQLVIEAIKVKDEYEELLF